MGVAGFAWPLIDTMNPARDVLALASVDVALEAITPGMGITVIWRGKLADNARDIVTFLAWAGDPAADRRKAIGRIVVPYFLAMAAVAYALKRRIWARARGMIFGAGRRNVLL